MKKYSVITVVYNCKNGIRKTIESVIAQNNKNFEYIIIDGNSLDGTTEIVNEYKSKIDKIIKEPDDGIYDAMNKGILASNGKYIIFINAGDQFVNNKVLEDIEKIYINNYDVIFGGWIKNDSGIICEPDLTKGFFNHQSIIYKRKLHMLHGDYVENKKFTTADYAFFKRLIVNKKISKKIIKYNISIIDQTGVSSGIQTFSQKKAIDFLFGDCNRFFLALILITHPLYRFFKKNIFKQ